MEDKKILVVEDDSDLMSLMTMKLEASGYTPIPLSTGGEALDYIKNNNPDLILLDIMLPDIDGISILNELALDEEKKKIPVIVLSNLDQEGSFEQVAALGNYEYLVKAKTELSEVVKSIKEKLGE